MKLKFLTKKNKNIYHVENQYNSHHDIINSFENLLRNDKHTDIHVKTVIKNEQVFINHLDESLELANSLIFLLSRNLTNNSLHMCMIHELAKHCNSVNYIQKKIRNSAYENLENEIYCQLERHFNLIDKIYLTLEEAYKNYNNYELVFKDEIDTIQRHFKNNFELFPVKYDLSYID